MPLGAKSRISFRLTHRQHQRYRGSDHVEGGWAAPTILADPGGHVDQDDVMVKEMDREDWEY